MDSKTAYNTLLQWFSPGDHRELFDQVMQDVFTRISSLEDKATPATTPATTPALTAQ